MNGGIVERTRRCKERLHISSLRPLVRWPLQGSVFGISSGSEQSVVLNLRLIDSPERREWNAHNTINIMKSLSANPALRLF